MVPPRTDPRWRKLVKGELPHEFKAVAASMMLSRLRRSIQTDGSEANISSCIDEFRAFAEKYEPILAGDFAAIFG